MESSNTVADESKKQLSKLALCSFWHDIDEVGQKRLANFLPFAKCEKIHTAYPPAVTIGFFNKFAIQSQKEKLEISHDECKFLADLIGGIYPIPYLLIFSNSFLPLGKEEFESGEWKTKFKEPEIVQDFIAQFIPEEQRLQFCNELALLGPQSFEFLLFILSNEPIYVKDLKLNGVILFTILARYSIPMKLLGSPSSSIEEFLGLNYTEISYPVPEQMPIQEIEIYRNWNTLDLVSSSAEKSQLLAAIATQLLKGPKCPCQNYNSQNWNSLFLWNRRPISTGTFAIIASCGHYLQIDWENIANSISLDNDEENLAVSKLVLGEPSDFIVLFGTVLGKEAFYEFLGSSHRISYVRKVLFSRLK